jgi:hypothetical protein
MKFLVASMKLLTKVKILLEVVTLLREPVPAFRYPPVTLKVVLKAACDSKNNY